MGSSSKLNYQIYKYILHLDMQNIWQPYICNIAMMSTNNSFIYSTQWIRKKKKSYNDVDCLIYG